MLPVVPHLGDEALLPHGGGAVVEPGRGQVPDAGAGAVLAAGGLGQVRVGGLGVGGHQRPVLVAAQVPVGAAAGLVAEEGGVLAQQVVHESGGAPVGDVDGAGGGVAVGVAQLQLGVGVEHRAEVAGRVDLGDDGDVSGVGQLHDPAQLGLGQVRIGDDLRVGGALDAERLVVGEVELELVELEVAHLADAVLDPLRVEVLAGDVDHEAALRAVGPVPDGAAGNPAAVAQGLEEGAGPVEHPGVGAAGDGDAAEAGGQRVALGAPDLLLGGVGGQDEFDVAGAGRAGGVVEVQLLGEQFRLVGRLAGGVGHDAGSGAGLPAGAGRGVPPPYGGDGVGGGGERDGGDVGGSPRAFGGGAVVRFVTGQGDEGDRHHDGHHHDDRRDDRRFLP